MKKVGSVWTLRSPPGTAVTLPAAQAKCADLKNKKFAGLSAWRLPTAGEMDAISTSTVFWVAPGKAHAKNRKLPPAPKARYTCVAAK